MATLWARPDILAEYSGGIKLPEIEAVRAPRLEALTRPHWQPVRELLSKLPLGDQVHARVASPDVDFSADTVRIGTEGNLSAGEHNTLTQLIRKLVPWRKGPFEIFGHPIDAEWRSDFKWSRIAPHLGDLSGKRVLDVGCNNGYYMLRALGHQAGSPECVIGVDPSESFYHSFEMFQRFIQNPRLSYQLLGVEHVSLFPKFFDVVLCLGIVYHQRDPLSCLESIRDAMAPGGLLVLESQAIPGDNSTALFAPDRYAKAHNVYFVPTASCLQALTVRAGFESAEIVSFEKVRFEEQRRTELAPYESLADFLDPQDSSKTVEGFPAPHRAIVIARAK